ncbi:MAG: hypothetical protein V1740_00820 [Candidatus Woesearchaeota archaeon]
MDSTISTDAVHDLIARFGKTLNDQVKRLVDTGERRDLGYRTTGWSDGFEDVQELRMVPRYPEYERSAARSGLEEIYVGNEDPELRQLVNQQLHYSDYQLWCLRHPVSSTLIKGGLTAVALAAFVGSCTAIAYYSGAITIDIQ